MRYTFIFFFLFSIVSCKKKINPYNFTPRTKYTIKKNSTERIVKKNQFTLINEIPLPKFVGKIYGMDSSWGALFFADKNSIYKYENKNVVKFYTPSKGRGPKEVIHIFRFDVIKDTMLVIGDYSDNRILVHNIIKDTSYIFNTPFTSGVQLNVNSGKESIFAEQSNNPSNKMFIKLSINGDTLAQFGHLFNNQYKSLNAFNMWVDSDNQGNRIVVGFLNAGYYTAYNTVGEIIFLAQSMQFPGNIPKYVHKGGMSYIDAEGKVVTGDITLYHNKFYVVSAVLGNKESGPIGSFIDVMNARTGAYNYSFKLNRYVKFFEMINDSTLAGITDNFTLAIWRKKLENQS